MTAPNQPEKGCGCTFVEECFPSESSGVDAALWGRWYCRCSVSALRLACTVQNQFECCNAAGPCRITAPYELVGGRDGKMCCAFQWPTTQWAV